MIRSISRLAIAFELTRAAIAADAAAGVLPLLARTAGVVSRFQEQFPSLSCTELVTQTKIGEHGKVLVHKRAAYDYLMLLQVAGDDLTVDESRILQGKEQKASDRALLTTSGFSTLLFIFHPLYENSFRFTPQGRDPLSGYERVRFEHIRGTPSPSVLQLRGREYPIEWQGTAWIDAPSGSVVRIDAGTRVSHDRHRPQTADERCAVCSGAFPIGSGDHVMAATNRNDRSGHYASALAQRTPVLALSRLLGAGGYKAGGPEVE